MRLPSISALLLALPAAVFAQSEVVSIEGRLHDGAVDKAGHRLAAASPVAPSALAELAKAPELELGALPLGAGEGPERRARSAHRVGRVRALAPGAVEKGSWAALSDGRHVWRMAIRSPEASELRVHFTGFHVGTGKVWIYGDDSRTAGTQEFSGDGLFGDGDFWSATVPSQRLTIEYMAADGLRQEAAPFQIEAVGHLWEASAQVATESVAGGAVAALSLAPAATAAAASSPVAGLGPAGSSSGGNRIAGCHLDVACFPEYRTPASGVARIIFAVGGSLYLCSGALVNTKSGNGTPLFLTASHCIDNEAAARSVQANFFFESESCGGGLRQVETVLGANHLVSQTFSKGDYSLIRLLGLPKSPVHFFGLTTEEPAIGTRLTGIHHPTGSYKRISFGPRTADETIAVSDGTGIYSSPADLYYQVDQREGRTEGGSSGSPLLNAKNQLVGTLSSGPVFSANVGEDEVLLCLADEVIDQYGRVSTAWPTLEAYVNDLRPAQMAFPQTGDKLSSKSVKFQWSPGVGVTEYRLLVGKTRGGGEYADVTLRAGQISHTVENLPENGSQIYGRLLSQVDGKWESADYSYLASSGSGVRAARLVFPAAGSQFGSSRVEFRWDEGLGASEYMLYVGSNPGGIEYGRRNTGKSTSAVIENLPGNGRTVYARIYSRFGEGWAYTDAIYRSADTEAKTFTLRVANRLAYPVTVLVNERAIVSILAGQETEQTLPRTGEVTVAWQLLRPSHPVSGLPLGENLGEVFAAVTPADSLSYEISNQVKELTYFTPVVTNSSAETFYVEMNTGTASRGAAGGIPAGARNAGLGYYRLAPTSTIRGYYGSYGYTGAYVKVQITAIEPDAGVTRVNLAVPAEQ